MGNFDRGTKIIQWGKILFSANGAEQLDIHVQKNEVGIIPYSTGKPLLQVERRSKCKS